MKNDMSVRDKGLLVQGKDGEKSVWKLKSTEPAPIRLKYPPHPPRRKQQHSSPTPVTRDEKTVCTQGKTDKSSEPFKELASTINQRIARLKSQKENQETPSSPIDLECSGMPVCCFCGKPAIPGEDTCLQCNPK